MPERTEQSGLGRRWTQGAAALTILALTALQRIVARQLLAWRQKRLPGWRGWFRVGRLDVATWLLCGLTAVVSIAGLLVWQRVFDGNLPAEYADAARSVPVGAAALGGLGFLIINGVI